MPRQTFASLLALQLVIACGYAVEAQVIKPADQLTLRMVPRVVSAPAFLRSLVRVAPNGANRVVRVEIDSDNYYRSSDIPLEGASAPTSHFVDWKQVPAGKYDLIVSVLGTSGDARAVRRLNFQVLGISSDER